jgi:uncharacterized coiled-coil DUF342 family protein
MHLSGWSKSMAAGKSSPRRHRLISRLARQVEQLERDEANRRKIRRYRSRADECRAHASEMHYPETQASLIQIAQCYDKMADFMEATRDDPTTPYSN